ncbi:MAG: glycoside hydrolase family 3 N-terminal domain-containing protein, partial [Chloroflexota bacterium]
MFLSKTRSTSILHWLVNALLIGIFLLNSLQMTAVDANTGSDALSAEEVIQQMTPEEKVGQLFLITFDGVDIGENSKIYDLVVNNHIGGVVLRADHDNFVEEETLSAIYQLTSGLQNLVWLKTQLDEAASVGAENNPPAYVPLFIGISQEGNGYPSDQILTGLTALPSALALGATWNPVLATQSGAVLGEELSALGFNLYLGPSLDVVDTSKVDTAYYLGTRSFGGDPYWVGEMGKAFIEGIHQGSENKIAVIAKHFPGQGGSDRPPEEEVATVLKSLEQLKQLELAPFFSVTGKATSLDAVSDGLMVSHIRYQGFQGNIRATTKPVSLDATALAQLMALDSFSTWRADGGLMVSDSLGSRAVRRFIDPTEETFETWQVARTAFLAGNDLLYLNDFIATGDPDAYTSILYTLEFFTQKYREDSAFAQRVDTSVLRILNSKIRLYQNYELENVLPSESSITTIGKSQQVAFDVAQQAVTLISPTVIELDNLLPNPPALYDRIVIFSDVRNSYQCSTCSVQRLLS